jgi:hypothetical protein
MLFIPITMIYYAWKHRHNIESDVIWFFIITISSNIVLLITLLIANYLNK